MTTSSSSAAEKNSKLEFFKKFSILFVVIISVLGILHFNKHYKNQYILKTRDLNGSVKAGNALFKKNCVGCHGVKARGLVGPDLHSVTQRLNDREIIKQVTGGLTPPMPSFEIEPQNMSNLLEYLHSLE